MSLISFRNFTSPLRSRFQIGVLVVLALMVAAVRYGSRTEGGKVATPPRFSPPARLEEDQNREIENFLSDSDSRSRNARQKRQAPPPEVSELESLTNGTFERERKRESDSREKTGKFDDIRKSLGLE